MSKIITAAYKLGQSATQSQNFKISAESDDGSLVISRDLGTGGTETWTPAITVDTNSNIKLNTASASLLDSTGQAMSSFTGFKNKVINGNFDVWQRGTSSVTLGYATADRWFNSGAGEGETNTVSQQSFTLGQTAVPNNPKYFVRNTVVSAAGTTNYSALVQRIQDVTLLAGKKVTLSFWAKADANKNIATSYNQNFGTGGSPSAQVDGISPTTYALTTSWQKFTTTVTIPSVSGKTLGSGNNDFLQLVFWFDAGSTLNSSTNSLGQQSGTFDIAQVQLEEGGIASIFESRFIGTEQRLCYAYYQLIPSLYVIFRASSATAGSSGSITYPSSLRATPSSVSWSNATPAAGIMNSLTPTIARNHFILSFSGGSGFTTNAVAAATLTNVAINAEL